MVNCNELKSIAKARLKSASFLMDAKDWDGAVYMMGHVLECALKACACKALHLSSYPESRKTDGHFMTHNFDQLLVLSGMSDIFGINASPVAIFQNWSEFTQEFSGDWPAMRYDLTHQQSFNEINTKKLYNNLNGDVNSILKVITKQKRW